MNKDVQVVVVTPDAALGKKAVVCPAIYLLHGYGGNAKTWIGIKPNLPQIADEKGIIFVCPDGKNSWYWDSPLNPSYRYETFISSELVKYIDEHYKTIADRKGRAITGLSMGGHGAMWNAIRHKDTFGASGSTSGGMDIRPFPKNWDMSKQLGEYESNKEVWDNHTVINQIDKIENGDLAIIVDCGEGDFFLNVNKDLHNRLLEKRSIMILLPVREDIQGSIGITPLIIRFCSLISFQEIKPGILDFGFSMLYLWYRIIK